MAKKAPKLTVVKPTDQTTKKEEKEWERDDKNWEQFERDARLTPAQAREGVLNLRTELERYREQLEGAAFGIASGGMTPPASLDGGDRAYAYELAKRINPLVEALFEKIDSFANEHGPEIYERVDFNAKLWLLRDHSVEAGFKVGMLAGVILSGAPKDTIDRFERGLLCDLCSSSLVVKNG